MNIVAPCLTALKVPFDIYYGTYRENPLDILLNILEGLCLGLLGPTIFKTSSNTWMGSTKTVYLNDTKVIALWTLGLGQFVIRNLWAPKMRLYTDMAQMIVYLILARSVDTNSQYAWMLFTIGLLRLQSTYRLVSRTIRKFV